MVLSGFGCGYGKWCLKKMEEVIVEDSKCGIDIGLFWDIDKFMIEGKLEVWY